MNLNKGCIEIRDSWGILGTGIWMNLNKGCIEIVAPAAVRGQGPPMNLNKGCIEISAILQPLLGRSRWTLNKHPPA